MSTTFTKSFRLQRYKQRIGSFCLFAEKSTKRVLFLGTPIVAASTLKSLINVSNNGSIDLDLNFEIVGVVTQPPSASGRNRKIELSPVHTTANNLSIPVFTPENCKDIEFLDKLESMNIDLCVTAAYGNYLTKRFLSIPRFGTINIHPSLLPKYRGAAPVQRCLENGDNKTGVTVLYTVSKMDAGPIVRQVVYPLEGNEKANKVLNDCFEIGTNQLIDVMPSIFNESIVTINQNDDDATHAPKMNASDALINFSTMSASIIHNKCRGYSDWPGIYTYFKMNQSLQPSRIKIITTIILDNNTENEIETYNQKVKYIKNYVYKGRKLDVLQVTCSDGSLLGIIEIQPESKKAMDIRSFINGFRGEIDMEWLNPIDINDSSI
eukprot:gene5638-7784_t